MRIVARDRRILFGISKTRDFINTRSAASIATSVPAPMAIPRSALVRATASLIPSPTIATFPKLCNSRITASFPSGRTSAMTASTPASFAIASAVFFWSPVSITVKIPCAFNSRIPSFASSFRVSATAMAPKSFPSFRKNRFVFPSFESGCTFSKNASSTVNCFRR